MTSSQSPRPTGLRAARDLAEPAPPITPRSIAFAAQMSAVSLERRNARQRSSDIERALELAHIKAQNACTTDAQRKEVKRAWNEYGAAIISEAQMFDVFAECARS